MSTDPHMGKKACVRQVNTRILILPSHVPERQSSAALLMTKHQGLNTFFDSSLFIVFDDNKNNI